MDVHEVSSSTKWTINGNDYEVKCEDCIPSTNTNIANVISIFSTDAAIEVTGTWPS